MPLVETVIHAKFQEDLKIFRGRARSPLFPIEKQWKEEKALLQQEFCINKRNSLFFRSLLALYSMLKYFGAG